MSGTRLNLAIAAPVRGEAPYLLEWMAFHRALGVQGFILGDNGGEDGTSDLLRRLHDRRLAIRLDFLGAQHFQLAFNALALEVGRRLCAGLFFVDVDEFLRPLEDGSSIAAVADRWLRDPDVGGVALNWAIFGTSGREEPGEGLVIERFTRRAAREFDVNKHAKPFVKVDFCEKPYTNPHAMELRSGRYIDTRGRDVVWEVRRKATRGITAEAVWTGLRVDHFVLKSRAEFETKKGRGDVASAQTDRRRQEHAYFVQHDRNEVEDPMPAWIVERTKAELERLKKALGPDLQLAAGAAG